MQTGQRIGTSVGIAVITGAVFASLSVSSWSTAFTVGFCLIGLVLVLALGFAIKDLRDRDKANLEPQRLKPLRNNFPHRR